MGITPTDIVSATAVLTALVTIFVYIRRLSQWIDRQARQDTDIRAIKVEQCLVVTGTLACLKGLKEQGCNGPVTEAIEEIEKHLNVKAHE